MMKLTAREREICDLVVCGLQNKEIAKRLGISPRTVEGYRLEIIHKLGVRNAIELVHMTYALGWQTQPKEDTHAQSTQG